MRWCECPLCCRFPWTHSSVWYFNTSQSEICHLVWTVRSAYFPRPFLNTRVASHKCCKKWGKKLCKNWPFFAIHGIHRSGGSLFGCHNLWSPHLWFGLRTTWSIVPWMVGRRSNKKPKKPRSILMDLGTSRTLGYTWLIDVEVTFEWFLVHFIIFQPGGFAIHFLET